MNTSKTIAIAGCGGYIGTHMTQAARAPTIARSYRTALESGHLPLYRQHTGREWLEKHIIDPIIDAAEGLRTHMDRP
jgi:hypothetical protein